MSYREDYTYHELDENCGIWSGSIPGELMFDENEFRTLWDLHPEVFHPIMMYGRKRKTPRWQQAFDQDYHYAGSVDKALPIPELLLPLRSWCKKYIDSCLNGILLNWYDGELQHYIGKHRDSVQGLKKSPPIVTISFGEERVFRLRPWRAPGEARDFEARDGSVFVMPLETNSQWTHEVLRSTHRTGRRISVTLRAFQ